MLADKESFKQAFLEKLAALFGKTLEEATEQEKYQVLGHLVREAIYQRWVESKRRHAQQQTKQVYYFSLEFMLGRLLSNNLINLGWQENWQAALQELGVDYSLLEEVEPDAGLGNGGLGRLAACFLDSLASLGLAGHGCGIRYKYGLFEQKLVNGYQVELPENWLKEGNVWETRRADKAVKVRFGGQVRVEEKQGRLNFIHENYEEVIAVPYDIPIIGYRNDCVNTLRLWSAEVARTEFDFACFSRGEYLKAVEYKYAVEAISQVLYPDDNTYKGRELRLKQQYFFVSAGIQSILRYFKKCYANQWHLLPEKIAIQVNDTHPVLVIPELMRILMDEEGLGWDEAWDITTRTVSYTNHTILAEALEKWPIELFKQLLPRIYMIVEEINERFCRALWGRYPGDWERIHRMAVVADGYVKMAHLALAGSYRVNGVARIHTEILKTREMREFYEYFPEKFTNKTNGITHRRWLLKANPQLAELLTEVIGDSWIREPEELKRLLPLVDNRDLQERAASIKRQNKERMARFIYQHCGLKVDPASLFDVQVKRIHAYKRQLLNILHVLDLYLRLLDEPNLDLVPRTFIFGGKAAPSYYMAKSIIKLINTVAEKINNDRRFNDRLQVCFLENYRVSLAELVMPAAEVSEQISTAGKEASGTGNMKFMMNGAITIGTRDGANIEIGEAVGEDNIVFFGLTADRVMHYYEHGGYSSWYLYNSLPRLKRVVDSLINGFLPAAREEFSNIYSSLTHSDEFFVLKDFLPYAEAQAKIDNLYRDFQRWQRMSLTNIACSGRFSSDRTIREYAGEIWGLL